MSDIAERLVEIGLRGHIAELEAEIERLQAGLAKAHRLLNQSIQWQRDAEITKAKQAAEIERLQAGRETQATEIDRLCAIALEGKTEIERLQADNKQLGDHWDDIAHEHNDLKAEIKQLREELASIGRAKFCDEERIAEQDADIERLRADQLRRVDEHTRLRASNAELVAALKKLLVECGEGSAGGRAIDLLPKKVIENAHAAIAKAEGSHERS